MKFDNSIIPEKSYENSKRLEIKLNKPRILDALEDKKQ